MQYLTIVEYCILLFIKANIKKKAGKQVCQYTKINNNAYYNGSIVKIIINGITYKSCALCHEFYEVDGRNVKYCPDCRKKANSIKTSQRYKLKSSGDNRPLI